MIGIGALLSTVVSGVTGYFQDKRKVKAAVAERKAQQASDQFAHDSQWELNALNNAGWMDDALFIAIVAVYVYSGVDPEGAGAMFKNWEIIPDWFQKVTVALVASIIGLKKVADYAPAAIKGIKDCIKG